MVDYQDNDVTTPNKAYNGNVGASDFTGAYSTEEYEWFWNVYQLAYNMNKSNTKQGSIDAIDAALNEAVEALVPTTTPYATETSAMDEMVDEYAGKIDTDYNEGFYGNMNRLMITLRTLQKASIRPESLVTLLVLQAKL